jgi:hypothetical protein
MKPPTLDELETLAPDPDWHPDATVKVSVGDLRAMVALIPAARELESVFGTYVVPAEEAQRGDS